MNKIIHESSEDKSEINTHGLSPLEVEVARLAIDLKEKAEEIPARFLPNFIKDIQKLANKRHGYFMHRSGRKGNNWVMQDVRKKVENFPYNVVFSGTEMKENLPYEENQVYAALHRIYNLDGELDLYHIGYNKYIRLRQVNSPCLKISDKYNLDLKEFKLVTYREDELRSIGWGATSYTGNFEYLSKIMNIIDIANLPKKTDHFQKNSCINVMPATKLKEVIKNIWEKKCNELEERISVKNGYVGEDYYGSYLEYNMDEIKFRLGNRIYNITLDNSLKKSLISQFKSQDFGLVRAEYCGKVVSHYDPFYLQKIQNRKFTEEIK